MTQTQEEKELLLKDLCGRLPYGQIVQISLYRNDGIRTDIELDPHMTENIWEMIDKYHALPYLRSRSSMTKEEIDTYHSYCECVDNDFNGQVLYFDTVESLDYLNSIHVDYRNLIPNLAIEVTEENNPYKD